MKKLTLGWWVGIFALSLMFVGMGLGLFYPEYVYVDLALYISLMAALLIAIFSIFKWGGSES